MIETMPQTKIYICPTCKGRYSEYKYAYDCKIKHDIRIEEWLMCKCEWGVRCDHNLNARREYEEHVKNHIK